MSAAERSNTSSVPELITRVRRRIVSVLNGACEMIDTVVYRPAVVKLAAPLPVWWSCQFARWSGWLDHRWGTGYWRDGGLPRGICGICKRRAAWLVIGGSFDESEDAGESSLDGTADAYASSYLSAHPLYVCGWCRIDAAHPAHDAQELSEQVRAARARSIAWRWRWP